MAFMTDPSRGAGRSDGLLTGVSGAVNGERGERGAGRMTAGCRRRMMLRPALPQRLGFARERRLGYYWIRKDMAGMRGSHGCPARHRHGTPPAFARCAAFMRERGMTRRRLPGSVARAATRG